MTAEDYLRRLAFKLRDLPWRMRHELISELRGHLFELPVGTDLVERLGTPEQYAADLRAAEGLERRRGPIAFLRARRPRSVILTVLALTVIGLGTGAVAWIDSYQPLAFGGGSMNPQGAVEEPTGGASVVFHEGRPFRYGFTVRNDGRYTVRVLGVPKLYGLPVTVRVLMSGPMRNGGMPLPSGPFRPVELKPGYTLVLYLEGRYDEPCRDRSGTIDWYSFPVRFGFLWRATTVRIPLPEMVAFVFPKNAGCR